MKKTLSLLVVLFAAMFVFTGCPKDNGAKAPTYPACEDDSHCADKGEFCADKQCVECSKDSHCKAACTACVNNSCAAKENCCATDADCSGGMKCKVKPGKKEGVCGSL